MITDILIVDDDSAIRDSMNEFIGLSGYRCMTAASAEEAIEILKKKNIHVVITDIVLPVLDGLELTAMIKRDYDSDVIVMTGYSDDYSYEEAINKGASDFVFKPVRFEELLLRLKRVIKERHIAQERSQMMRKLEKLAITDGLTSLYNSRCFYDHLESEIDRSVRYHHEIALMLMDIDYFKQFNDTYGHLAGDKVLIRLGEIIRSCLRTNDSAYRYGGEEFTVILPETNAVEAKAVAQRIRTSMGNEPFITDNGDLVTVTISIGVTEYNEKEKLSTFVKRTDKAMYLSKQQGRNRVSCLYADETLSHE
ncbi:MAG: diguanylate cyclase [Desulfobacterales bacterium]|nr:diguanylate cyclase [Desulfobacterales bacterium]MDD4072630.1 diguanylate cyclase [Desulfobacterales bacterium]MDD4391474.1 diguanylate cyclase [Desulfobacterales bacterium]